MSIDPIPPDDRLAYHRIDQLHATLRFGMCALLLYYLGSAALDAIASFAGKSPQVDLALSVILASLADFEHTLSWGLAGLAVAWAYVENVLRHRKVDALKRRIVELETEIDPGRSSSGILPRSLVKGGNHDESSRR